MFRNSKDFVSKKFDAVSDPDLTWPKCFGFSLRTHIKEYRYKHIMNCVVTLVISLVV
jgi:hypothetical protein